jgi:S1-C subfamily serine protease
VLRVADASGLRTLPLGSQGDLRQGQTVVAVGFPGNSSLSDALTSTVGVVSVVRSAYREPTLDVPNLPNVVQTDAALNPGNSGGPLMNLDGRLVGVNSAGRTLNASGRIIQGQSYAIGVDQVREVIGRLRLGQSQGWYGLGFRYLSASEAAACRPACSSTRSSRARRPLGPASRPAGCCSPRSRAARSPTR